MARRPGLSYNDIGFLMLGISFASRPLRAATTGITAEYSLGPRGAWFLRLISRGGVYPLDIAKLFQIGRSLVTAELVRLADAGLITYRKTADDGRRSELTLTSLGNKVNQRVKAEVRRLVTQRLGAYSREEILLCARMLRDFQGA